MALVIPSIFRAIDGYSNPVRTMAATTLQFEQRLHALGAGSERAFRRATNIFSNTTSSMFDYAKSLAVVGGVIGGASFSLKSLVDYEDKLASFRTIVSDLSDADFSRFRDEITRVAFATNKSTVDVASNFEKIAGLNAEFAKTAAGLGQVSTAAITLAKASRMDLGASAEALTGIMNQFSFSANQANRTINVLAAGQAVGAANIMQTAEALNNFGATAAGANVTLEQSIALIQTMAKFGQQGSDAGHRLRSALIKVQETGLGYSSGKFDIVEGLEGVRKKYDALGTAKAKDAYLTKVFGLEQITAGRILVSNTDLIRRFTTQVTGTSEAQRAAAINTNTFVGKLTEMRDKWVTIITTSTKANSTLSMVRNTIGFLTDHMEGILSLAAPMLGFFVAWRAGIWAVQGAAWMATRATAALNFVQGIGTVITRTYATACFGTAAGIRGMALASFFLETGLWGSLGVIAAITAGVLLLANNFSYAEQKARFLRKEIKMTKDGIVEVNKPITDASIALERYTEALEKYNEKRRSLAYDAYLKKYHFMTWYLQSMFKGTSEEGQINPKMPAAPNRANFPGLDTSATNKPYLDSLENAISPKNLMDSMRMSSVSKQVIEHQHVIDLKQNGERIGVLRVGNGEPSLESSSKWNKTSYS